MQRLDKILSEAGIASRRELKQIIKKGRVTVNGIIAQAPEMKVDEETDSIFVDGKPIARTGKVVLMLHKPAGVVSSTKDPHDKTVLDILPTPYRNMGLFPIGRLDKDTEGLLLLTNDGNLAHHLTAPRHHVAKIYYAKHTGVATQEDVEAFQAGLCLRDGTVCQPAQLEPLGEGESKITIQEGKYHQVRRMMASRGMTVFYLKRLQIGKITLGDLPVGQCRRMTSQELEQLE